MTPLTKKQVGLFVKNMEEYGDECDKHEEEMYDKVFRVNIGQKFMCKAKTKDKCSD